ncbi:hypothetical protein BJF79_43975 [Actinomadura sp. CNU-125]|uniref:hypothetical protein n=1 Tax=Actinomadura sp. CNU-125 TaxID=1904961 RepID=UPI000962C3B1|nr:hypothetical protein [Actinomadura sp. CNU-125]OLT25825.1 hypothetical protein BJF79_43975 [Actinomadura sp. CNU-125]
MLTPLGRGTAAASAVLYAAGWWLGYPEPAAFAVAGLVAVAAAAVWTLPGPKLEVRREIGPAKVGRGEPATGILHVTSAGRGVRGLTARDAAGSAEVAVDVPRLRAGATRTVSYGLPTDRRGRIAVGPLRLVRADPLRLARRVREYGARGRCWCAPGRSCCRRCRRAARTTWRVRRATGPRRAPRRSTRCAST